MLRFRSETCVEYVHELCAFVIGAGVVVVVKVWWMRADKCAAGGLRLIGTIGIRDVKYEDGTSTVKFENGKTIEFEDVWLRDNCRCSSCYFDNIFQRAIHLLYIPDVAIINKEFDNTQLKIKWSDNHESVYEAEFLFQFDYETYIEKSRLKHNLWCGDEIADKVARVDVNSFLNTKHGARLVFKSILDYGVAFIEQVEPTTPATEIVCKALGGIQNTFFGGMWEFSTVADHADSAYTNLPLAVLNDNTYLTEATGLQILHCIVQGSTGGETILVDGFYGATRLKEDFPEDFEFLTKSDVEAEFVEDIHHYRFSAPVIKLDKLKDIQQIRFNIYDRSPMAFSNKEECKAYYRSLKNLSRYLENPKNQWQFKLKPGVVMVMDNFRILHGRTRFTGKRVLTGSYVSRSDWLDRARTLGLIN